jgi:hypothetical protein
MYGVREISRNFPSFFCAISWSEGKGEGKKNQSCRPGAESKTDVGGGLDENWRSCFFFFAWLRSTLNGTHTQTPHHGALGPQIDKEREGRPRRLLRLGVACSAALVIVLCVGERDETLPLDMPPASQADSPTESPTSHCLFTCCLCCYPWSQNRNPRCCKPSRRFQLRTKLDTHASTTSLP